MIHRFQEFVTGITECYKFVQRIKNTEMTELGLKGMHVTCLFYLHHSSDGMTAAQLCQICCEDKATISRAVRDLREKGYIQPGTGKNYRMALRLTREGQQVAMLLDPIVESWVAIGGDGMSEAQRQSFYESLSLVASNLQTALKQTPMS